MSAWVSPVCGRAFTMLSIFTASTRFSEGTGSPVNRDWDGGEAAAAALADCPQPHSASGPATTITAATAAAALRRVHVIALSDHFQVVPFHPRRIRVVMLLCLPAKPPPGPGPGRLLPGPPGPPADLFLKRSRPAL